MRPVLVAMVLLVLGLPSVVGSEPIVPRSKSPQPVAPEALLRAILEGRPPLIVDVRPAAHFARGSIPGSVNVPHKQVPGRWDEIEPYDDRGVVIVCQKGLRTRYAARALTVEGLERVGMLTGSLDQWQRLGYPLTRPPQ